jgi:uncharacterized OB-fold protein
MSKEPQVNREASDGDTAGVDRLPIRPAPFTAPYWEAAREHRLVIQFCPDAQRYQFFPMPMSQFTGRRDLEWREVLATGQLYSYTVTHRGPGPFRGHEPYVVASVDLDAGVRVIGLLVGSPPENIEIGMPVIGCWSDLPDGNSLLMFTPQAARATWSPGAGA